MPLMDGIEATQIIRDMGYTRPIVALTANAVVGQSLVFLSSGFDGFIPKPIDAGRLNMVLNKFIRDRHHGEIKKHKPETAALQTSAQIPAK